MVSDETKAQFQAGRQRVANLAIPELIGLLESPEFATRFAAEMRLRQLAGL